MQNSLSGESNYQMPSALQTRRAVWRGGQVLCGEFRGQEGCVRFVIVVYKVHCRVSLRSCKVTRTCLFQGFSTSRLRPTMQRIVVRTSIHDAEPLGNSYSDAEYPRPRATKKD